MYIYMYIYSCIHTYILRSYELHPIPRLPKFSCLFMQTRSRRGRSLLQKRP